MTGKSSPRIPRLLVCEAICDRVLLTLVFKVADVWIQKYLFCPSGLLLSELPHVKRVPASRRQLES